MVCDIEAQANREEYYKEKNKSKIRPFMNKMFHCGGIMFDLYQGFKYPYLTYLKILKRFFCDFL